MKADEGLNTTRSKQETHHRPARKPLISCVSTTALLFVGLAAPSRKSPEPPKYTYGGRAENYKHRHRQLTGATQTVRGMRLPIRVLREGRMERKKKQEELMLKEKEKNEGCGLG